MASSTAFLEVALSNEYIFVNALNNDIVMYPSNESQDILLGSRSNANAALAMSVSNVNINVIPTTSGGNINFTAGTTGNNNLMSILGNGNVGIGNASPGFRLDVSGFINATNAILSRGGSNCLRFSSADPGDMAAVIYSDADRYGIGQYAVAITRIFAAGPFSTSSIRLSGTTNGVMTGSAGMNDYVTVLTGTANARVGCVGIGTTAPNSLLHISGNALSNQLTFSVADGGTNAKNWAFGPNGNVFAGYIQNDSFASPVNWIQCTRSANTVTNVSFPSGNVGIGQTSPVSTLDVAGTVTCTNIQLSNLSNGSLYQVRAQTMACMPSSADAVRCVSTWTSRTVALSAQWNSVCWSPELRLFVAVTPGGTLNSVMTSTDGINWTSRTAASSNQWNSVCWSPERGLFVAVAYTGTGNRVMTSSNGINWTSRTSAADNQWFSVCWSPELSIFVAVAGSGSGNRVMTSPDGITWTSRTSASNASWWSVCWSPERSLFVAISLDGSLNSVMTSSDGINWTSRTAATNNQWYSVCWSAERSLFVAVANSGTGNRVMTSSDGITWTTRTSAADNQWRWVCWSPEMSIFVAVAASGTGNRVMSSQDGITWTSRTSAADNDWQSVCWSPELSIFASVGVFSVMTSAIGKPSSQSTLLVSPAHMTVNNTNGNVGIGTTNPTTRLSVAGNMNVTGTLTRFPVFDSRRVATLQNINNTTITTILFDAVDYFSSGSFPLSYSAGVWTNTSGQTIMCTISYTVSFSSNGSGVRQVWIVVNGSNNAGRFAYTSQISDIVTGSATLVLNNGETFGINTWQTSGATATIGGAIGGMDAGFSTRIQIGII